MTIGAFYLSTLVLFLVLGIVLAVLVGYAVACGVLARRSAKRKGHAGYFWTGFFLGALGVAYVAGLPDKYAQWERQALQRKLAEIQRRIPQIEEPRP